MSKDPERARLLRAVCEDPYDVTPRLIFADYLEEYGERADLLHAAMIRRQIVDEDGDVCDLLTEYLNTTPFGRERYNVRPWRNGFVEEIELPAEAFLAQAEKGLFAEWPVIGVTLKGKSPYRLSGHADACGWYSEQSGAPTGARLPSALFSLLPRVPSYKELFGKFFGPEPAALKALSDACVSYGRELAGLPPLRPRKETPCPTN